VQQRAKEADARLAAALTRVEELRQERDAAAAAAEREIAALGATVTEVLQSSRQVQHNAEQAMAVAAADRDAAVYERDAALRHADECEDRRRADVEALQVRSPLHRL
jgi:hypothetical protein